MAFPVFLCLPTGSYLLGVEMVEFPWNSIEFHLFHHSHHFPQFCDCVDFAQLVILQRVLLWQLALVSLQWGAGPGEGLVSADR